MEGYEYILEELLKRPTTKKVGTVNQIRMECPVCHKPDHKLYIGVMHGSNLLGYDCKQCPFQGKVGPEFLKMFNISCDSYISDYKMSKKSIKTYSPITHMEKIDFKFPTVINEKDLNKVRYLENRFQKRLTANDIQTYKIILNLNDFFEYNNFDYLQYENDTEKRKMLRKYIKEYSEHFVGMASVDNNKINLRNVDSVKINKRYMVHVINKNLYNPYLYMPDVTIDLCEPEPVINMSEGNFDIIGVRMLFFKNSENMSNIFAAVGTKGAYRRAFYQILKMTGFVNAKINIYSDYDLDSESKLELDSDYYYKMFSRDKGFIESINLIYNSVGKDFGDLSKPIKPMKKVVYL